MTTRDDIVAAISAKYTAVLDRIDREAGAEMPAVLERVEHLKHRGRQRGYLAELEARRRATKTTNTKEG